MSFNYKSRNLIRKEENANGELCYGYENSTYQDWEKISTSDERYDPAPDIDWSCPMESRRCEYKNGSKRCKRMTRKQIPYCWQHMQIVRKVIIKPAGRKGLGLFACDTKKAERQRVFKAGDNIALYARKPSRGVSGIGEIMSSDESQEWYGECLTQPYAITMPPNRMIDTACERSIGSYANGAVPGRENAVLMWKRKDERKRGGRFVAGPYLWLVATKAIHNGTEILWDYGDDYRYNYPAFFKRRITHKNRPETNTRCRSKSPRRRSRTPKKHRK